jgi:hypothetical protein
MAELPPAAATGSTTDAKAGQLDIRLKGLPAAAVSQHGAEAQQQLPAVYAGAPNAAAVRAATAVNMARNLILTPITTIAPEAAATAAATLLPPTAHTAAVAAAAECSYSIDLADADAATDVTDMTDITDVTGRNSPAPSAAAAGGHISRLQMLAQRASPLELFQQQQQQQQQQVQDSLAFSQMQQQGQQQQQVVVGRLQELQHKESLTTDEKREKL